MECFWKEASNSGGEGARSGCVCWTSAHCASEMRRNTYWLINYGCPGSGAATWALNRHPCHSVTISNTTNLHRLINRRPQHPAERLTKNWPDARAVRPATPKGCGHRAMHSFLGYLLKPCSVLGTRGANRNGDLLIPMTIETRLGLRSYIAGWGIAQLAGHLPVTFKVLGSMSSNETAKQEIKQQQKTHPMCHIERMQHSEPKGTP